MTQTITPKNIKRKRKLDPSIIRIGDDVRIIIPECVERVGYPLTKKMIVESMTAEQKGMIEGMITKIFDIPTPQSLFLNNFTPDRKSEKLYYSIASFVLQRKGWGGRERRLHKKLVDEAQFKNKVFQVIDKKVVKTGDHVSGHCYQDYFGEYDYDPAYLENEKTHVLYGIGGYKTVGGDYPCIQSDMFYFEKRCVQKVIYNPYTGDYE